MQGQQRIWRTAIGVTLAGIVLWHLGAVPAAGWRWSCGLLYFVFGVALLGGVARRWPGAAPLWRPGVLLGGTLLSFALFAGLGGAGAWPQWLDAWMAALLGLTLACLLPRGMPAHWRRSWLGQERRHGMS